MSSHDVMSGSDWLPGSGELDGLRVVSAAMAETCTESCVGSSSSLMAPSLSMSSDSLARSEPLVS